MAFAVVSSVPDAVSGNNEVPPLVIDDTEVDAEVIPVKVVRLEPLEGWLLRSTTAVPTGSVSLEVNEVGNATLMLVRFDPVVEASTVPTTFEPDAVTKASESPAATLSPLPLSETDCGVVVALPVNSLESWPRVGQLPYQQFVYDVVVVDPPLVALCPYSSTKTSASLHSAGAVDSDPGMKETVALPPVVGTGETVTEVMSLLAFLVTELTVVVPVANATVVPVAVTAIPTLTPSKFVPDAGVMVPLVETLAFAKVVAEESAQADCAYRSRREALIVPPLATVTAPSAIGPPG